MIYTIEHRTIYDYEEPVTASFGDIRQLPGDIDGQRCLERSITVAPEPQHTRVRRDYFGNEAMIFESRTPHQRLEVISASRVDTSDRPSRFPPEAAIAWEQLRPSSAADPHPLAVDYSLDSPLIRRSSVHADYARRSFRAGRDFAGAVSELNHRINDDFQFDPTATDVDTPLDEVLANRRGVCQDFAHVMIAGLRSIGLPACYVSGYLETVPPPGQQRLTGVDRTHAWVGVPLPSGGWIGIDPTNDQVAGPRYITTAHGRDYGDVPPMRGVIFTDAETSTLTVSVDVLGQSAQES
jgi:transglutaminase-like putative cysteine protease